VVQAGTLKKATKTKLNTIRMLICPYPPGIKQSTVHSIAVPNAQSEACEQQEIVWMDVHFWTLMVSYERLLKANALPGSGAEG
jgi:hypothetical protein